MGKGSDRSCLGFASLLSYPVSRESSIVSHLVEDFRLSIPMLNKSNEQVMRGSLYNVF